MTYSEALDLPVGELVDFMTIEMIKKENLKYKPETTEEDEFFSLLERR